VKRKLRLSGLLVGAVLLAATSCGQLKVPGASSTTSSGPGQASTDPREALKKAFTAQLAAKSFRSLDASKEEQKPAAKNTPDELDYIVYSALIDQPFIVIKDNTDITKVPGGGGLLPKDYSRFSEYVSKETFADFIAKNERALRLDRQFTLKADYVLLSQNEIEGFSLNWRKFSEKYPVSEKYPAWSQGIVGLSNIGYNKSRNEAMVHKSFYCGHHCCSGSYIFLTKEQDGWRIKKELQAEIC